ncbi:dipeptide ABC transporter ATP-binding protein [Alkalinema pantanalense CENA528]|uniref:dipeptide ABC transporter ATP-binding protein n=1 Tax=Alkalinema pantanalense TaxID=1620705 RepID=UPI003D6EEE56
MAEALLTIDHLKIAYRPQTPWVVDDVSLVLQPGERLGLVGESGCGKSTIGRAIVRLLPEGSIVEGQIQLAERDLYQLSDRELRQLRGEEIALIFQDPMTRLNPLLTIGEHCLETLQAHRPGISTKEAKSRALEVLQAVNIPAERWAQYPHEFSGGMRQRVAIALALLLNPKLIIADEPTTSLDVTVAAQILQELKRLCEERNMALILISHDLALVGEYCDRIAVMYNGQLVELGTTTQVLQQPQHDYTQTLLQSALSLQAGVASAVDSRPAPEPLLRLRRLKQYYTLEANLLAKFFSKADDRTIRAVDGIDLDIFPGETLGLVGESGCGKSTLSRTILQLLKPTAGQVEFLGQDLARLKRQEMLRQRRDIQMIFQDPHACLNPRMTIGESIADPLLIHRMATPQEAKPQVEALLQRVGLHPQEFYDRYPSELSGGQQQRVAIARALITRPKLVICDEPVSMLDATVRTQVLELMQELKDEFELTYLFITHDLWVARFFCDRIAVMYQGKIVELDQTAAVFDNPQHSYTQTLLAAAPMLEMDCA